MVVHDMCFQLYMHGYVATARHRRHMFAVMYGCHNNYNSTGNNSIIAIQRKGSAINSRSVPTKTTRFHSGQRNSTFIGVVLSNFRPGVITYITKLLIFTFNCSTYLPMLRLVHIGFIRLRQTYYLY